MVNISKTDRQKGEIPVLKRWRVVRIICLVLILLILSGCGSFSGPPGSLQGYVYIDKDSGQVTAFRVPEQAQEGLSGAIVTVAGHGSTVTSPSGYFWIGGIRPGYRRITVEHPSLRDPFTQYVYISSGQTTYLEDDDALYTGVGYYIIIGIDDFPNIEAASDCGISDAQLVYNTLIMENNLAAQVRTLYGSEATKQEIYKAIEDANSLAKPEDYLVIYYSGLGGSNWDFGDHIYPYDATDYGSSGNPPVMITDVDLDNWLSDFPGKDVTVILESANSRNFADGVGRDIAPLALRRYDFTVLAAAGDGEGSYYYYDGDRNVSLFTYHLVEGIGSRDADTNYDHAITARELYDYTRSAMDDEENVSPYLWEGSWRSTVLFRY